MSNSKPKSLLERIGTSKKLVKPDVKPNTKSKALESQSDTSNTSDVAETLGKVLKNRKSEGSAEALGETLKNKKQTSDTED